MKAKIWKTIGLTLATAACIGMTVFAAPSPTASTPVSDTVVSGKDANGNTITASDIIITSSIAEEYKEAVNEIQSEEGFAKIEKELNLAQVIGVNSEENLALLDVKEVHVEGNVTFPVTLTFQVKGVTAATKGTILHYNGSAWEVIDTTMGEGTMTGTFSSLSPVAFVVDKTTLSGTNVSGNTGSSSTESTSPKTEAAYPAEVGMVGLTGLVVLAALKKRV